MLTDDEIKDIAAVGIELGRENFTIRYARAIIAAHTAKLRQGVSVVNNLQEWWDSGNEQFIELERIVTQYGDARDQAGYLRGKQEALAQQGEQQPVAWLDLHKELGQLKWAGRDEGWDMAIRAVQKRLVELDYAGAAPAAQPKGWVEP